MVNSVIKFGGISSRTNMKKQNQAWVYCRKAIRKKKARSIFSANFFFREIGHFPNPVEFIYQYQVMIPVVVLETQRERCR